MSKVTAKLQITLPKTVAVQFDIHPGDNIEFVPQGDVICLVPESSKRSRLSAEERLQLFDASTERQRKRERNRSLAPTTERGWTREELYTRGLPH